MAYGKIYETTWWGNPQADGWGNVYYDFSSGGDAGDIVMMALSCGEFDNRGSGVNYSYKDVNGTTQTGFLGGDGQILVSTRTGYLGDVTDTDGGWLYAVHGGRINITSLTNSSAITPRSPQGYPDYLTGNTPIPLTEVGTIPVSSTWTGSVNVAMGILPQSIGDTTFVNPGQAPYITLYQISGDVSIDAYTVLLPGALVYNNG